MNKLEWDELFWSYRTYPTRPPELGQRQRENELYRRAAEADADKCIRVFRKARRPPRGREGRGK